MLDKDACGNVLKESDRQAKQVTERLRRDANVHPVGGIEHQIAAEEAEHRIKYQRSDCADRQDIQCCEAFVDKDFVDNELEENRDDQSKRIKKNRSDGDINEESPFAQQLRGKPAEAKFFPRTGRTVVTFGQKDDATPISAEACPIDDHRLVLTLGKRIYNPNELLAVWCGGSGSYHHPVAVGELHRGGVSLAERKQCLPVSRCGARAQPCFFRHSQHHRLGHPFLADGVCMIQALHRKIDAVMGCNPYKTCERGPIAFAGRLDPRGAGVFGGKVVVLSRLSGNWLRHWVYADSGDDWGRYFRALYSHAAAQTAFWV